MFSFPYSSFAQGPVLGQFQHSTLEVQAIIRVLAHATRMFTLVGVRGERELKTIAATAAVLAREARHMVVKGHPEKGLTRIVRILDPPVPATDLRSNAPIGDNGQVFSDLNIELFLWLGDEGPILVDDSEAFRGTEQEGIWPAGFNPENFALIFPLEATRILRERTGLTSLRYAETPIYLVRVHPRRRPAVGRPGVSPQSGLRC